MADDVAGKCGKKAKGHFKQAVKARTAAKLKTALELMDLKTRAYLDTRTKGNDKTHLYLATANVRGNDTGNKVESTNAWDKAARLQCMDRGVVTLDELQRTRFFKNKAAAESCGTLLPPKLQAAFDVIKSSASRIDGITILDPSNEGIASVTGLGGASVYRTNISGEGGDYMHEVYCECSEISAREYGLPCVHCVGHAEHLGITPEEIVHCKDTTAGWRRQYEGLEYPMLSTTAIQNSDLHDATLQYPPVDAPKCGRPKRAGRIKSSREQAEQRARRQRQVVKCTACLGTGHNKRNAKCPEFGRN